MADGSLGIGRIPTRRKKKSKKVADMFCGASGMGSGAKRAITELGHDITLVGVNHWEPAIRTSQMNHPGDTFLCADLHHKSPRDAVPWGTDRKSVGSGKSVTVSVVIGGGRSIKKNSRYN